jgi:hypothetical protein
MGVMLRWTWTVSLEQDLDGVNPCEGEGRGGY